LNALITGDKTSIACARKQNPAKILCSANFAVSQTTFKELFKYFEFMLIYFCNLDDWYHYGCVNFSKKQADSSEKYRCPMCDEWYSHKKRRLLKEFGSGKTETCDILVGNVPKFNLMDFISVALFADTRIGILISNTKKQPAESAINDVISALSFIPLFSSKLQDLGLFKSRKYIQDGLNLFLTGI